MKLDKYIIKYFFAENHHPDPSRCWEWNQIWDVGFHSITTRASSARGIKDVLYYGTLVLG